MTLSRFPALFLPAVFLAGGTAVAQPKPTTALEGRGHIVPMQLARVGSEVSGQVVEVLAAEGQRVKKGDLLLRFDPTLKEIEVKRAEAGVALARAHLKELETGTRPEEILQAGADLRRVEAEHDLAKL